MIRHCFAFTLIELLVVTVGGARAGSAPYVPVLTDAEAWEKMPTIDKDSSQRLPVWIRALAVSLPKTAASMLDLDYAQRMESTLPRVSMSWG